MLFLKILVLGLTISPAQAAERWPQYGGPTGDFRLPASTPSKSVGEWKREFGPGTSGVVADNKRLYTMYVVPKDKGKAGDEFTVALDPTSGKTLWQESIAVKMRPKQESFRASPMQPQATPAVFADKLFTLGFTGILQARDAATGKEIWTSDLVTQHAATPVQFGFAASPIVYDRKLIVHVGGKHAVMAFDLATGNVLWKTEPAEPSYATPVVMTWDNKPLIVQLTRDQLFGFDPTNGAARWTYTLPTKGLTNVPTPIPLSDGRLLVSGQGLDGTRLLQLVKSGETTEVKEVWHQRKVQFFYTNWVCDGDTVVGFAANVGKRFTGLRITDGSILFQDAGQTDANVLAIGKQWLVCRGDGLLSLGSATAEGFKAVVRGKPVSGHCWTPPTLLGDSIIVRSESELALVKLSSLAADFKPPADTTSTALEDVFGSSPPKKKPVDQ